MNPKIVKQSKEIKALATVIPKKNHPALNTIVELYENGYFTNIKTALNLAKGLYGSGTSQIKTLEKIAQLLNPKPTIVPVILKQFFVTADVTVEIMWSSSNRSGKNYTVKPSDVKNKTESDNYKTFAGRPLEIYATSESDAISKYQDAIISTLELAEYEKISKVSGFKNVEVVDMSTGSVTHPRDIMMKASSHVSYNFIPNDESLLKKNDVLDMCVPTQFVGIYGDLIKKLTDEYFIKLCYQVRGEVQISNITQSRLDIDFCDDEDDDEPVMPTNQWTIADGVSPSMLCKICEILNISHYAYDFSNNCFLKNIATSRHYPVLCYYALSGHMYLVSNKDKIKSMIEKS